MASLFKERSAKRSEARASQGAHTRNLRQAVFVLLDLCMRLRASLDVHDDYVRRFPNDAPSTLSRREQAALGAHWPHSEGDPTAEVHEVARAVAEVDPVAGSDVLLARTAYFGSIINPICMAAGQFDPETVKEYELGPLAIRTRRKRPTRPRAHPLEARGRTAPRRRAGHQWEAGATGTIRDARGGRGRLDSGARGVAKAAGRGDGRLG